MTCEVDFSDYSDDADPVEFWNRREVTARKPHRCTECKCEIAIGERHEVVAYKFEGEFKSDRVCLPCREAATEFEYHIMGGDLWGMLCEEWDRGAHLQACINRLSTARAKEHMRQQWLKWQEREAERARRVREMRQARAAVDPVEGKSTS
jgi:hypothetical protein